MTLASINLSKLYPYSKWEIRSLSQDSWTLPPASIPCFKKYYILYWTPKHLESKIHDGVLDHQNTTYLLLYHRIPKHVCMHSKQVALSFRAPQPAFDLPPIVLVSAASDKVLIK